MNFSNYLNKKIECECGQVHSCDIKGIIIEKNALKRLPQILRDDKIKKVCVIYDNTTYKLAGKKVEQLLMEENILFKGICLRGNPPLPDEKAVEQLEREISTEDEIIIAVGSGTINDICKYYAYQKSMPYMIIATAPSMDGYASNVSAMLFKNAKVTAEAARPRIILADSTILCEAPMHMIAAGVGDMLGKYVCLADWKLSHLITGEYYCEYVKNIMKEALEKVADCIPELSKRDKKAIEKLTEGLILSGIAMSYLGNSRPASGSEHHLSHYWEMLFLQQGKEAVLHGTKVGVGTVIGLFLYHALSRYLSENETPAAPQNDAVKWEENIQNAYGICAPQVLALEHKWNKNKKEAAEERNQLLWQQKEKVFHVIEELPSVKIIISHLKLLDAPFLPEHIGVESEMTENAIRYAKDLRNRYGILQLYYDIEKQEAVIADFKRQAENLS